MTFCWLLLYAVLSNVAMAVVPHEPAVIAAAPRLGIWVTAAAASIGTLLACIIDYCLLLPRMAALSRRAVALCPFIRRAFVRWPFAILAVSGVTPLPFWPFKILAFGAGYPAGSYLLAVSLGRVPRYLLLAWLGHALPLTSPWLWIPLALVLLIPLCRKNWGGPAPEPTRNPKGAAHGNGSGDSRTEEPDLQP